MINMIFIRFYPENLVNSVFIKLFAVLLRIKLIDLRLHA